MDSQTFTGIAADKWNRIKTAVHDKTGITISTDVGANGAKGITLGWTYVPSAQTLKIDLVKRSFYDPSTDVIDADIKELVEQA